MVGVLGMPESALHRSAMDSVDILYAHTTQKQKQKQKTKNRNGKMGKHLNLFVLNRNWERERGRGGGVAGSISHRVR